MNKFDYERRLKILEILVGLKFLYIILATLNIISYYGVSLDMQSILIVLTFVCCVAPFMVFCSKMMYGDTEKSFFNMPTIYNLIEILVLLGLFIILMSKTGGSNSSFKYISTIIILICSIQYKKEISFAITIAVSLIILAFNQINVDYTQLISYKETARHFEGDIILVSSLLITSFILSLYINIENEYNLKLKELAVKDGLTGLLNHRSFQDVLDTYITDSQKEDKEVSLLFMDIDNFKNYNDINGHQKGDWLLTRLGEILRNTVDDLGVVARYGGEEFAIILYDQTEEAALNLGELIRQNIQQAYFTGQELQPNKNITVSIGVSTYPKVAKNKKQLIELADNALYRAKSFDKNRVERYYNILDEIDSSIDKKALESIANILNKINKKDKYTYGHSERVVIYAKKFATYLDMEEKSKKDLLLAAYLHDIGKLEISKELLNKREKLSQSEFNILRQHPTLGADLVSNIEAFNAVVPVIKYHHEKYDGSGYPNNIKGNEIPYLARVLTIIDSFDAMTSKRPYNVRKDYNQAIIELKKCAGTHFDVELVSKFIDMLQSDMIKKKEPDCLKNILPLMNDVNRSA
ncbi:MAG: diguanylate cyclase [Terrisporobacter othiniensis]|uniref:bifunctional diguanylate cyclase/phosphohydrolase n=1 Tax=Terrisporobacter petrolearius TaxID=1460447 RepID=UPI0008EEE183|nr:diguanylate cyclase [Terrisporobacter petrolearius]MDU4861403.1 diguanylate cyclase [Terrisporobacter othiniensis]MDU6994648.1 diguanylate cyclase [Terrisporobacter othiniensis]SFJ60283.1 diguanylate cyclase (GGDEF) domain-containing protein/HDIG domain-containing protein [Terrisporobacter glycolicus]